MKNASVVIALVVGLVLGLVIGRMTVKPTEQAEAVAGDTPRTGLAEMPQVPTAPTVARAAAGEPVYKVPVADAAVKGKPEALVTIIEFSDFECPFCSRVGPTLAQIEETYGADVRVAFKHNPLPFHANAVLAAEATEAANAQGKFWPMHDKLFANQKALKREDLERYAQEIGLDMARFRGDLDKGTYKAKIQKHQAEARALGASGTPSFFINGKFLRGAQPFDAFKRVIDTELASAKQLVAKGTPPARLYETIIASGKTSIQQAPSQQQQAPAKPQFAKVQVGDAFTKGPADAKVTIIAWSDFQCPFCSRVNPTMAELEKAYGNDLRIAFKHQPLSFHQQAQGAAEAAEAAGAQGKFWEMHDKLFENQKALTRPDLDRYAQEIGLDVAKFKSAMDQGTYTKKVKDHSAEGMRVGARGTPTFFINGRLLSGAQPVPAFKSVIDEELKQANALLGSGTPRGKLYDAVLAANEKKYGAAAPAGPTAAPVPAAKVEVEVGASPVKGPAGAPITIVTFSDFECPFCGRVNPTLAQVMEQYPGKVRIAFKHQPLPFHKNAQLAAEASMAAHAQGKFWQMHDKLFENQKALTRPDLDRFAQELGLNLAQFKADLDGGKYTQHVKNDQALAFKVGANGTPTFFVNGRKVVGAVPFENFKSVIDEELKKN